MSPALLAAATTAVPPTAPKGTTPSFTLPPNFQFDTTPHSWLASHAGWLTHTFAALFVIFGVLFIILLAIQTTKQEGLSGTLGGRVESSTRRLGLDGQIARVTQTVAIGFVVLATVISLSGI
jgi:preprotein translocase subunit SecG